MGVGRSLEDHAELVLGGLTFRDVFNRPQDLERLAGMVAAENDLMATNPSPGAIRVSATIFGVDHLPVTNVLEATPWVVESKPSGILRIDQLGDDSAGVLRRRSDRDDSRTGSKPDCSRM